VCEPWPPHSIQNNMLIMLAESRHRRCKLLRHPAYAGTDIHLMTALAGVKLPLFKDFGNAKSST
jgi:hypothetical protein